MFVRSGFCQRVFAAGLLVACIAVVVLCFSGCSDYLGSFDGHSSASNEVSEGFDSSVGQIEKGENMESGFAAAHQGDGNLYVRVVGVDDTAEAICPVAVAVRDTDNRHPVIGVSVPLDGEYHEIGIIEESWGIAVAVYSPAFANGTFYSSEKREIGQFFDMEDNLVTLDYSDIELVPLTRDGIRDILEKWQVMYATKSETARDPVWARRCGIVSDAISASLASLSRLEDDDYEGICEAYNAYRISLFEPA